ncbi:hypothetical protein H074_19807 [Amycolatopsis decaplanina DSM 44594]|uniref:Uncharacterized protein n=1 Tax=Amycolatopsis decaplanina DSM 44594 TaxID=1284240 RepID=M2Y794_9PSEU|nr:hypothetical protein H074_19807 [Amycolatopsis decaplanina DSM 44594]
MTMTQQSFGGFPPRQQYAFPNQAPARSKDSGLATAALIFSLFGLIGLVSVIPGIVMGHVAAFAVGYLLNITAKHGAFR